MKSTHITNIRLISQQIAKTKLQSPKEMVGWMGAMQAQDYNMAKWAIGVRLPKATQKSVDAAIDKGEIIRTHLLRPTWHFVSADDIYWMLELTAPRLKGAQKSREKQLELTAKILAKSNDIFGKVLSGNNHLTRAELLSELKKARIAIDNNRASHILFNAELEGIICSGKAKAKQNTYALLNERVPKNKKLHKDEALTNLAKRYFDSRCPATLQDFTWWSGLSVTDAKLALEMVKPQFLSEEINSKTYWFPDSFSITKKIKDSAYLLPAFDEFLISYKDRTAALDLEHHPKAFSNNGIFWPTILVNGRVEGIWKRTLKKDRVIIETKFFSRRDKNIQQLVDKAAQDFGFYTAQNVEIIQGIFK